ncbi:hypothetical protein RclHR1_02530014 [Rhizophagus clarus]|uniref:Uncharacterized protein n=1 Tax=Rhizophagus clarus TaxID=94130 RepID=A0A2Z6RCS3_9GLOM|nr:hypothetical protein RclHR1_02530014 [Rhizophagus clarus]
MIVMKDLPDNLKNNVRDVMLYDILVEWFPETILTHLTTWGQVALIHNRSTFTAKVKGLPVSVTTDPILTQDYDKQDSFFKDQGLKAYKFLKQGTDHVTILGYFENYKDLKTALESPFVYERTEFKWYRSSGRPPKKNSVKNSARSSQKRSIKDSGAQGSPKSSSKPGSSRSVKRNPPSKNKNKKTHNSSLDKADILKLVLSLLKCSALFPDRLAAQPVEPPKGCAHHIGSLLKEGLKTRSTPNHFCSNSRRSSRSHSRYCSLIINSAVDTSFVLLSTHILQHSHPRYSSYPAIDYACNDEACIEMLWNNSLEDLISHLVDISSAQKSHEVVKNKDTIVRRTFSR